MKTSTRNLVSIALCTYNGEKHLDKQIQSILNQDYRPLEIVISDDNSSDKTWQVLKEWQNNYPDIISISCNTFNIGYNKNFEKAIKSCNGTYIAISDQDDIWRPDKVSKLINLLKKDEIILAQCQSINFNDEGVYKCGSLERQHTFNGDDVRQIAFYNRIEGHNMIFKRSLLEHILPFPPDTYYDWWIAAIATNYGKIATIDEYLVHHRIHEDNYYYSLQKNNLTELNEKLAFINALLSTQIKRPEAKQFLIEAKRHVKSKIENKLGRFDHHFFKFLLRHRETIFGFKKRKTYLHKQWTMVKSAFKLSSL